MCNCFVCYVHLKQQQPNSQLTCPLCSQVCHEHDVTSDADLEKRVTQQQHVTSRTQQHVYENDDQKQLLFEYKRWQLGAMTSRRNGVKPAKQLLTSSPYNRSHSSPCRIPVPTGSRVRNLILPPAKPAVAKSQAPAKISKKTSKYIDSKVRGPADDGNLSDTSSDLGLIPEANPFEQADDSKLPPTDASSEVKVEPEQRSRWRRVVTHLMLVLCAVLVASQPDTPTC